MQEERIPTIVWLTPILPFINDTEENLKGILEYCVIAGVKGIVNFGMGVTLREGNREYFYHALDQVFPGLSEKYRNKYGYDYVINSRIANTFCISSEKSAVRQESCIRQIKFLII